MNCRKAEKLIYLYRELTPSQQKLLDKHLSGCTQCRALMESVNAQLEELKNRWPDVPADFRYADLTREMMASLPAHSQAGLRDRLAGYLGRPAVRYAFTALSIFLVAAFAIQYNDSWSGTTEKGKTTPVLEGSVMNTAQFFRRLRSKRNAGESRFERCITCWSGNKGASCPDCDFSQIHEP